MKVTLTAVKFYETSKEGQPLLDKNSRPYTRVNIQTDQHGKSFLSGLAYQGSPVLGWRVGQQVDIDVVPNGQYLNFNIPKPQGGGGGGGAMSAEIVEKLFTVLRRIETKIDNLELVDPNEPVDSPEPDQNQPPY